MDPLLHMIDISLASKAGSYLLPDPLPSLHAEEVLVLGVLLESLRQEAGVLWEPEVSWRR